MTTLAASAPRTARFAPVWKARGHRRLVGAVVATGRHDGRPVRMVLTAERVAIATVSYRGFDADFTASALGRPVVERALTAAAALAGIRGRAEVSVGVPTGVDSGADLDAAAAYAAVDALYAATEVGFTPDLRAALSKKLTLPLAAPAEDGFGAHDETTGLLLGKPEAAPRFYLAIAHRPGSSTDQVTTDAGLPTGPVPLDEQAAAAWLEEANGTVGGPLGPVVPTIRERVPFVLGAVGGHTDTDPVAFLLPGAHETLTLAQGAFREISAFVSAADPGRRLTLIRQGRV